MHDFRSTAAARARRIRRDDVSDARGVQRIAPPAPTALVVDGASRGRGA